MPHPSQADLQAIQFWSMDNTDICTGGELLNMSCGHGLPKTAQADSPPPPLGELLVKDYYHGDG